MDNNYIKKVYEKRKEILKQLDSDILAFLILMLSLYPFMIPASFAKYPMDIPMNMAKKITPNQISPLCTTTGLILSLTSLDATIIWRLIFFLCLESLSTYTKREAIKPPYPERFPIMGNYIRLKK